MQNTPDSKKLLLFHLHLKLDLRLVLVKLALVLVNAGVREIKPRDYIFPIRSMKAVTNNIQKLYYYYYYYYYH